MSLPQGSRQVGAFAAWALVGAAATLGVLAILTIGLALLVVALAAAVGALRIGAVREGMAGLLVGAAAPLAYIGWLNREGPGLVCRTTRAMTSCSERWAPWPWFAAAAACVVGGLVLFAVLTRRTR